MIRFNYKNVRGSGVIEQVLSSGGSFLFFIFSARQYGIDDFSHFAYFFAGVQMLHSLLLQWVFLPIISMPAKISNKKIKSFSKKKMLLIFILTPFFGTVYLYFQPNNNISDYQWFLFFSLFSISYSLFDYYKYILIRNSLASIVVVMQCSKWLGVFLLIIIGKSIIFAYFVPVMVISMLVIAADIYYKKKSKVHIDNKVNGLTNDELIEPTLYNPTPLLFLAICTNIQNLMINISFSLLSAPILGALLAFRSATNIIPVILQYVEIHMTAKAANNDDDTIIGNSAKIKLFSILLLLFCVISFYSKELVEIIYGHEYSSLYFIFPAMLFMVFVQSISRLISAELRLKGKIKVFYYTAAILVASGGISLLISNFRDVVEKPSILVLIVMITTPVFQLLILFINNRNRIGK